MTSRIHFWLDIIAGEAVTQRNSNATLIVAFLYRLAEVGDLWRSYDCNVSGHGAAGALGFWRFEGFLDVDQVLRDYFNELEEESIKDWDAAICLQSFGHLYRLNAASVLMKWLQDNFVITYELLDEMMDNGYPQTTEAAWTQFIYSETGYLVSSKSSSHPKLYLLPSLEQVSGVKGPRTFGSFSTKAWREIIKHPETLQFPAAILL